MRAYGELIANVAKTVDQFMTDNISAGAGRDWLAERFPDTFEVDVQQGAVGFAEGGEAPPPTVQLVAKGENPERRLAEISRELGVNPPITDISDPNAELKIVTAARLQMAKSRQQLLASMVMLGINRIVVTDGTINAKVVFDMRAEDKAKRNYTASMNDTESQTSQAGSEHELRRLDVARSTCRRRRKASRAMSPPWDRRSTRPARSKAEVKAKLSGEVRVNFKSDYLPLEKMATPEMMSVIQGNSTPYNPNKAQPAASGART